MYEIKLPKIDDFDFSIYKSLKNRKSIRVYNTMPVSLTELSYLLWAAKSIPSAGALRPLKYYLYTRNMNELKKGFYRYNYLEHKLVGIFYEDIINDIYENSLFQDCIINSSILIFICADFNITKRKYGERGIRYVYIEAGHSSQSIYLIATALNLGTVAVGAFNDLKLKELLNLPSNEELIYIMPVGKL